MTGIYLTFYQFFHSISFFTHYKYLSFAGLCSLIARRYWFEVTLYRLTTFCVESAIKLKIRKSDCKVIKINRQKVKKLQKIIVLIQTNVDQNRQNIRLDIFNIWIMAYIYEHNWYGSIFKGWISRWQWELDFKENNLPAYAQNYILRRNGN